MELGGDSHITEAFVATYLRTIELEAEVTRAAPEAKVAARHGDDSKGRPPCG
jgi:hypothetical protein